MTILDTNVLSALMRAAPEMAVVRRLDDQPAESIWITGITLFEARLGLALLPRGKRRHTLESAFERLLEEDLENRVLDFDSAAATEAASLAAARQRAGRRSTCAIHRSRESRLRGALHLPRAMCGTSRT